MSAKAGSTWPTSISVWPLRSRARHSATRGSPKVGKEFEGIYQEYAEDFVGWEAHYGNARTCRKRAATRKPGTISEEVQAADASDVPDAGAGEKQPAVPRVPRKSQPDWEDNFFSAVERQYLKVLYAVDRNGDQGYYKEFKDSRKMHGPSREKCPEYQGLTLDYARQLIQAIGTAKDAAKQRAYKRALELLVQRLLFVRPLLRRVLGRADRLDQLRA